MGAMICSLAARPVMANRENASIINISSVAAFGCPTAYGVSKLAVSGLTVTIAREFKFDGILANVIAPGLIFTDNIRAELPKHQIDLVMSQKVLDREGEGRDIIEMMLYLVSSKSSFITGETFRVSGGFSLYL